MKPAEWYEVAKRYLWPHTLVPLALIVIIEYARLLGELAQIVLTVYVLIQTAMFVVGVWGGMMLHLNKESLWKEVLKYNMAKVTPTLKMGYAAAAWLVTSETKDGETTDPCDTNGE